MQTKKATPVVRRPPPGLKRPPRRPPRRKRATAPAWLQRSWEWVLDHRPDRESARPLSLVPLVRADFMCAAGSGVVAAALYATTLTGHPALGDAPETISGVSSLGILHAPGYPAYVILAKLFTLAVPFGGEAFRINLFSLVCASVSVGLVALLARRCGAARWASAAAALCLAATAGFVFYSGFAKHDMFSGLVFLITLFLTVEWAERPSTGKLVAVAAAIGVGLGSSWPLEVLIAPALAFVLIVGRRALSLRALASAVATGLVIVVALYGFVLVRASENPAVNWGDARNLARLEELVRRTDFTPAARTLVGPPATPAVVGTSGASGGTTGAPGTTGAAGSAGAAGSGGAPGSGSPLGAGAITFVATVGASSVASYMLVFVDELGAVAALLALVGLAVTIRHRRVSTYPLLIAFLTNLLGAASQVGPGSSHTLDTALVEEGFLIGCYFILAVWIAVGATELVQTVKAGSWVARVRTPRSLPWLSAIAAVAVAAAAVVPSFSGSRSVAERAAQPFADRYAASVFAQLPSHAVVFMWGAELTQPLIYRQVVKHERPDVVVVSADGLSYPWYREEVQRSLGRTLPPRIGNASHDAAAAATSLIGVRPVYLDPQAIEATKGYIGYRPTGLLAEAVRGTTEVSGSAPAVLAANLRQAEAEVGLPDPNWNRWPNAILETSTYSTAGLIVARSFYAARDIAGMRQALLNVLRIEPANQSANHDIALLRSAGQG